MGYIIETSCRAPLFFLIDAARTLLKSGAGVPRRTRLKSENGAAFKTPVRPTMINQGRSAVAATQGGAPWRSRAKDRRSIFHGRVLLGGRAGVWPIIVVPVRSHKRKANELTVIFVAVVGAQFSLVVEKPLSTKRKFEYALATITASTNRDSLDGASA